MRGPHDVGGLAAGPVDTAHHEPEHLEKQVDGMLNVLVGKQLMRVDEMRRNVEQLGHEAHLGMTYYDRWTAALMRILVEKGAFSQDEVDAKVALIRKRLTETGRIEHGG